MQATLDLRVAPAPPAAASSLESLLHTTSRAYGRFALRRKALQPPEIQQLAERLLTEENPVVRRNLLHIFTRVKFPLDYRPILALARQKMTSGNRLATEYAIEDLQHLRAPAIRAFALQRLASTTQPGRYAGLLVSNYEPGDAALLTALVGRFHNEHTVEALAVSCVDIYRANPTPECAAPLLALYHKMNCGLHRKEVVQLLLENDVLPTEVNEEIAFDSFLPTRQLHRPA
ncbi:hypothetical protein [Hymenobacter mellowenesis]|uniref:hypothetical protein n=1 Tax=Hymenobacter mellowenesis TaxID=3063995 RepID=UPI00272A3BC2|nr:hypothetical protein [Hymenobacter sp. M29]